MFGAYRKTEKWNIDLFRFSFATIEWTDDTQTRIALRKLKHNLFISLAHVMKKNKNACVEFVNSC